MDYEKIINEEKIAAFNKDLFIGVFKRVDSKNEELIGTPEYILQPIK